MTTFDFTGTGGSGTASANFGDQKQVVRVLQNRIDLVNPGGTGTGTTFQISDVIKWFTLQAGWVVLAAGFNVVTACDGSSTLTVGDSGSSTQYVSATSSASTGFKTPGTTPKQYTAVDFLASTVGGHTIATGIVEAWAIVADASYRVPAKVATL